MQGKKRWLALLAVVVATGGILAVVGYYLGSWYVLLALLLLLVLDEFIALWLFQDTSKPALTGMEAMIGKVATVITDFQAVDGGKPQGKVCFNGEIWSAEAKPEDASKLSSGSKVSICSVSGLLLKVKASNDGSTPTPD